MSNHHVNHVILVGKVLQTWSFEDDRGVRLQMRRAAFQPPRADGPSDLVIVILPGAIPRGQQVSEGDELHIEGFIRNTEREVLLSSLAKGIDIPANLKKTRVKQLVTEVVAINWQIIPGEKRPAARQPAAEIAPEPVS
ncbi:MAG: hypothetical protein WCE68_18250 [Anaerolineales bacterium]